MNHITITIAWRYLTQSVYEKSISVMVAISFIGIFIGSCALALVAAIIHGFDVETRKQIQGVHAQAIIKSNEPLDIDALNEVLFNEFPSIIATSPTSSTFCLIQTDNNQQNPLVALITAIDPATTTAVNALHKKIIHNKTLSVLEENQVIVGVKIAEDLSLKEKDTIQILYASDQQPHKKKLLFNTHTATIGGILKTGHEDIDSRTVLCNFDLFNTLFPDIGIQELQLSFKDDAVIPDIVQTIRERTQLAVYTWQDLYPALLAALNLEEYVSFLVIALITMVASMNILALLFMHITSKRTDIALLKTIGMSTRDISTIFVYIGFGISLCASICGVITAAIISFCINYYQLFPLPDVYYVSHVPAHMTWYIPVLVFVIVCLMTFCATLIPIRQLQKLSVSTILRFEG